MVHTSTGAAEESLVLVDSGSMIHVCPRDSFEGEQVTRAPNMANYNASGDPVTHYGRRTVDLQSRSGSTIHITFEVADVARPIISVNQLLLRGVDAHFGHDGGKGYIGQPAGGGRQVLDSDGSAHFLHLWRNHGSFRQPPMRVMPITADPEVEIIEPEQAAPVAIALPAMPDQEAVRQHCHSHIPFALWCKICVEAKATQP